MKIFKDFLAPTYPALENTDEPVEATESDKIRLPPRK